MQSQNEFTTRNDDIRFTQSATKKTSGTFSSISVTKETIDSSNEILKNQILDAIHTSYALKVDWKDMNLVRKSSLIWKQKPQTSKAVGKKSNIHPFQWFNNTDDTSISTPSKELKKNQNKVFHTISNCHPELSIRSLKQVSNISESINKTGEYGKSLANKKSLHLMKLTYENLLSSGNNQEYYKRIMKAKAYAKKPCYKSVIDDPKADLKVISTKIIYPTRTANTTNRNFNGNKMSSKNKKDKDIKVKFQRFVHKLNGKYHGKISVGVNTDRFENMIKKINIGSDLNIEDWSSSK